MGTVHADPLNLNAVVCSSTIQAIFLALRHSQSELGQDSQCHNTWQKYTALILWLHIAIWPNMILPTDWEIAITLGRSVALKRGTPKPSAMLTWKGTEQGNIKEVLRGCYIMVVGVWSLLRLKPNHCSIRENEVWSTQCKFCGMILHCITSHNIT